MFCVTGCRGPTQSTRCLKPQPSSGLNRDLYSRMGNHTAFLRPLWEPYGCQVDVEASSRWLGDGYVEPLSACRSVIPCQSTSMAAQAPESWLATLLTPALWVYESRTRECQVLIPQSHSVSATGEPQVVIRPVTGGLIDRM